MIVANTNLVAYLLVARVYPNVFHIADMSFVNPYEPISPELRSAGKAAVPLPDGYMEVRVNDVGRVLLDQVDGRKPLAMVLAEAGAELPGVEPPQLLEEWIRAFASLYRFNLLVLNPAT